MQPLDEPDTIPFNIPIGSCCNPESMEEFQQLLRVAIRARLLTTGEILEIILDQVIKAGGAKARIEGIRKRCRGHSQRIWGRGNVA
jgi:hypothetical protein